MTLWATCSPIPLRRPPSSAGFLNLCLPLNAPLYYLFALHNRIRRWWHRADNLQIIYPAFFIFFDVSLTDWAECVMPLNRGTPIN